ncbi:MAG: hypothetical protein Q8L39_13415 [Burkholderiales bacterium]|nr:hypothetical protein [Burkholderiales bacterium]
MGYNKKVGVILMAVSVLAAIWLFLISECMICSVIEGVSPLGGGYSLKLLDDSLDISYKYIFLACLSIFTVGLLFFLDALNAPFRCKLEKYLGGSAKSDADLH